MADKFPMTVEEACAYIQDRYGEKCSPQIYGGIIDVSCYVEKEIPMSELASNRDIYKLMREFGMEGASLYESPDRHTKKAVVMESVRISDFKKSLIDEKLAPYIKQKEKQ